MFLASKSKPSEAKEALQVPATDSVAMKPAFSCDECGHTTQTVKGMKLHVNNKHELGQVGVQKHFSLESLCTFSRLNERFESELNRGRVKKCEVFEREKVSKKWTRYEVVLTVLKA